MSPPGTTRTVLRRSLRVLIVVDDAGEGARILRCLEKDFAVQADAITMPGDFAKRLSEGRYDLVVSGAAPAQGGDLEVLAEAHRQQAGCPVVMVAAPAHEALAREAMQQGLAGYIVKTDTDLPCLLQAVHGALQKPGHREVVAREGVVLAQTLEAVDVGLMICDADDRLLVCNERLRQMYPLFADAMQPGSRFVDIMRAGYRSGQFAGFGEDEDAWLAARLARTDAGAIEREMSDGRVILICESRREDGGRISAHTDVTALRQRERELRQLSEENARLAAAVRHSTSGIVIAQPVGGGGFSIVYVNPAFEQITGYSAAEVAGRDCRLLQGPDTDPDVVAAMHEAMRQREPIKVEVLNYRKNGATFWNGLSLTPIFNADGSLNCYVGALTDVTEPVGMRLMLQERTQMLAEAERIAHLGHWSWEIDSGRVWWSDEIYRIRGLDPAGVEPTMEVTLGSYHPDDREAAHSILLRAARYRSRFAYDVRVLRPDGELRYAHVEGRFLSRGAHGTGSLFGIFQDVTERRLAQEALQHREEQYRRLMETVPLGIMEMDTGGRITYTNRAYDTQLGYGKDALLGARLTDLTAGEGLGRDAQAQFDRLLKRPDRTAHFVSAYRTVDGGSIDVEVRAAATRDGAGKAASVIAVASDITQRLNYEKRLRQLAFYDALTGLGNRALFRDMLQAEIGAAGSRPRTLAVAFINVDGFKVVNEAFGRGTGDFVVKTLAARLQAGAADGERIARVGGDEFGVLMLGSGNRRDLVRRLNTLKNLLETPIEIDDNRIDVSLSVGAAVCPQDGHEVELLLQGADTALREAKQHEPGGIRFYNAEMKTAAEEFMTLRSRLREARLSSEFFLDYQPQVELRGDRVIGFEALLRWRTADGSIVPPSKFIPIAEQSGDIVTLGWWIIETVCMQIGAWKAAGTEILPVSVNVSARQFLQDDLPHVVARLIQEANIDPHYIQLELTETTLMADSRGTLRRMQELNDLGVSISLDDFGTGYSSLSYLSQFPIHCLKIDRSFIVEMTRGTKPAAMVSAVIAMGHRLGLDVMAEGVETERQLAFLKSHQCDLAQGFYYSRPIAAAAAARLMQSGARLPLEPPAFDPDGASG